MPRRRIRGFLFLQTKKSNSPHHLLRLGEDFLLKFVKNSKLEKILEEVTDQYNLTYGEKVRILTSRIQDATKYVIRWERHMSNG